MSIARLIKDLTSLYETITVARTLVMALDDEEAQSFVSYLTAQDHSVMLITEDDIQDERPRYLEKLQQFSLTSNRVLVMTFGAWTHIRKETEFYAMDHNVLVVGDLENQRIRIFMSWVSDARDHGFCNKDGSYHTMFLDSYLDI